MANRIKIRRGSGTPTGSSLLPYEIGWSTSQRALYINNGTTDAPVIRQLNSETVKGIPLVSGDNIDQLANLGVYYSEDSTISAALSGTVPTTGSGFRLEVKSGYGGGTGYGTNYNYGITQIAYDSSASIKFRKKASNYNGDFTNVPWQTIVTSTNVDSYALPITGGTLTGNLSIQKDANPSLILLNPNIDTTAATLSGAQYNTIYFRGTGDRSNAYVQAGQNTNGSAFIIITSRRRNTNNDANVDNTITLRSYADGTVAVVASHPAAWRDGIGAVNIAGDTMTGNLFVQKNAPSIVAKDPNGVTAQLIVGSAHQNHGIYSTGYSTDGTQAGFVSSTKWIVYRDGSGDVYLNGNAASATYTSNIRVTSTTPTASTSYFLLFTTGQVSGTNYVVRANDTVRVWIGANLSSAYLSIGDSSHYGGLSLYSSAGKYLNLRTSSMSDSNKTIIFPNANGTVALAEEVLALSGGDMTGTIVTTSDYGFNYKYSFAKGASGSGYKSTWCIRWTDNTGTLDNAHSYGDIYNQRDYSGALVKTGVRAFKHAASSTDNVYLWVIYYDDGTKRIDTNGKIYGAVWNDYAEYRDTLENSKPGQCVIENGDDSLRLSTSRMQRAAHIVSDTFGFAIGKTEKCKTPVAVSGRVLAYIYEGREAAREAIGRPVCSGPNGTVSIMTDEEYKNFGYCAIGTISAVPEYEKWGEKGEEVDVNGRIWIKVY